MKANKVDLEDTIDVDGLAETLEKLGDICFEKSEHLVSNWQDAGAAAQWEKAAFLIHAVARKIKL